MWQKLIHGATSKMVDLPDLPDFNIIFSFFTCAKEVLIYSVYFYMQKYNSYIVLYFGRLFDSLFAIG
ncbi:hypothetical protein KDK_44330 [Dictyobacter kobayashii]|uniref:Uncharacterized protein n=1 Tax=Dictyobacter kobayashii TaxID=2014872 RepID=A0A402AN99_9CHLR|nr:hypothetical protein KDK_44330 [Dictyobacter kobayashii]